MKASQLMDLAIKAIPAGLPLLIQGAPGVGKSDIIAQAAEYCEADLVLSHPALSDPTDAKGLAWMNHSNGTAEFMPLGELNRVLNATRRTVWFLDDLGQATAAVQASYMQWLLNRQVGNHRLPDCVTIFGATNRRQDKAGVTGILAPVCSRFASIVELDVDVAEWYDWALQHDIATPVMSFIRDEAPTLLSADGSAAQKIENFPSPRTWANVSKWEALDLPRPLFMQAIMGAVGEGAAVRYMAFRDALEDMVKLDHILANPTSAPLPTKPAHSYATAVGLASRTTFGNFGDVAQYCQRWFDMGKSEFVALCFQDINRRDEVNSKNVRLEQRIVAHKAFNPALKSMGILEMIFANR